MPGLGEDIVKLTPHLRRFARALVRDHSVRTADDLVQETVVLIMKTGTSEHAEVMKRCFATLIQVHRLRCREVAVARQVGGRSEERQDAPARPDALTRPGSWGPTHFAELPLECREMLLLAALAGFDYAIMAEVLGLTFDRVVAGLTAARDRLSRLEEGGAAGAKAGHSGASPGGRTVTPPSYLRVIK